MTKRNSDKYLVKPIDIQHLYENPVLEKSGFDCICRVQAWAYFEQYSKKYTTGTFFYLGGGQMHRVNITILPPACIVYT